MTLVDAYTRSRKPHPVPTSRPIPEDYISRKYTNSALRFARGSAQNAMTSVDDDDSDAETLVVDMPFMSPNATSHVSRADDDSIPPLPAAPARRARKETIRRGIYIDTVTRNGSVVRELFGSPTIECPGCGALAVCRMPPILASLQDDGTEFACLPHHGGCGGGLKTKPLTP
jgi:hypothetical protein